VLQTHKLRVNGLRKCLLLFTISQYKLYKHVLNEKKQFRYMKVWHTAEEKSDTLAQNNLLLSFWHT